MIMRQTISELIGQDLRNSVVHSPENDSKLKTLDFADCIF